jgi:hypothetical protein
MLIDSNKRQQVDSAPIARPLTYMLPSHIATNRIQLRPGFQTQVPDAVEFPGFISGGKNQWLDPAPDGMRRGRERKSEGELWSVYFDLYFTTGRLGRAIRISLPELTYGPPEKQPQGTSDVYLLARA